MSVPVCSIVIPTRDCLKYLPTALATIDLQFYEGLEVIVVDDGSTDGTAEWLARRKPDGFDLKVIRTEGIGPAAARNCAIAAARSALVAFLDADDIWHPGKLHRQIAFHQANPDVGFSFTDYIHVATDGRPLGTCFEYWSCGWTARASGDYVVIDDAEAKLLATNLVGTSTVVARRDALDAVGGFSPSCRSAEDWDLWLRLAAAAKVGFSASLTMSYLMRPGSETAGRERRIASLRDIANRYQHRRDPAIHRALRIARARMAVAEAEHLRESGNFPLAARAQLKALSLSPDWRTCKGVAADVLGSGRSLLERVTAKS